jgi:hypothetical protein
MLDLSQVVLLFPISAPFLLTAFALAFTAKGSFTRANTFVLIVIACYNQFSITKHVRISEYFQSILAGTSTSICLQSFNLLLITNVDINDLPASPAASITAKFRAGLWMAFNIRGVKTRWQVKNVPAFPAFYNHQPPRSRSPFLTRQAVAFAFDYMMLDLIYMMSIKQTSEEKKQLYGSDLEYHYLDLTAEQWTAKIASTLITWYIIIRVSLDFQVRFLSLASVALGICSPDDWPPMFGRTWDAYTLRHFWG